MSPAGCRQRQALLILRTRHWPAAGATPDCRAACREAARPAVRGTASNRPPHAGLRPREAAWRFSGWGRCRSRGSLRCHTRAIARSSGHCPLTWRFSRRSRPGTARKSARPACGRQVLGQSCRTGHQCRSGPCHTFHSRRPAPPSAWRNRPSIAALTFRQVRTVRPRCRLRR